MRIKDHIISVLGLFVILIADIVFMVIILAWNYSIQYITFIGPLICLLGLIVFLFGLLINYLSRSKETPLEKMKLNLLLFYSIPLAVFIISLFFPYSNLDIIMHWEVFMHYEGNLGNWIGLLFILASIMSIFSPKFNRVLIFNIVGSLSMTFSIVLIFFLFRAYGFTASFYIYILSVIAFFSAIYPIRKTYKMMDVALEKEERAAKFLAKGISSFTIYNIIWLIFTGFFLLIIGLQVSYYSKILILALVFLLLGFALIIILLVRISRAKKILKC